MKSEIGCEANCFKNDNCMSMNFGPLEDGKHVCELSGSDHDIHPEDLKHQMEFIYRPVLVSDQPSLYCLPTNYKFYRRQLLKISNMVIGMSRVQSGL